MGNSFQKTTEVNPGPVNPGPVTTIPGLLFFFAIIVVATLARNRFQEQSRPLKYISIYLVFFN
jgi:hypothetical protein